MRAHRSTHCVKPLYFRPFVATRAHPASDDPPLPQPHIDAVRADLLRRTSVRAWVRSSRVRPRRFRQPLPPALIFHHGDRHPDLRGPRTPSDCLRGRFALRLPFLRSHHFTTRTAFRVANGFAHVFFPRVSTLPHASAATPSAASVANVRAIEARPRVAASRIKTRRRQMRRFACAMRWWREVAAPRCSARARLWRRRHGDRKQDGRRPGADSHRAIKRIVKPHHIIDTRTVGWQNDLPTRRANRHLPPGATCGTRAPFNPMGVR